MKAGVVHAREDVRFEKIWEDIKMSLVITKELLLDAQKNGYAVGAFNVENMEMVQAVVAAAEELNSPVVMQKILVVGSNGKAK